QHHGEDPGRVARAEARAPTVSEPASRPHVRPRRRPRSPRRNRPTAMNTRPMDNRSRVDAPVNASGPDDVPELTGGTTAEGGAGSGGERDEWVGVGVGEGAVVGVVVVEVVDVVLVDDVDVVELVVVDVLDVDDVDDDVVEVTSPAYVSVSTKYAVGVVPSFV